MDIEKIMAWGTERMRFTEDMPLEQGYRYYHGLRVASLALELAEGMDFKVDKEILFVGGFLHDVGKAGYKGPEHGPRGAELIRAEIPHLFSGEELDRVTAIVANHYMRPNSHHFAGKEKPAFPHEVLLVQDADIVDHFGSNGIWLAFHWSAHHKRSQQDSIDYHHGRDVQWRREAYEGLNFPLSKQELKWRIKRMDEFMTYWEQEEKGKLTLAISCEL